MFPTLTHTARPLVFTVSAVSRADWFSYFLDWFSAAQVVRKHWLNYKQRKQLFFRHKQTHTHTHTHKQTVHTHTHAHTLNTHTCTHARTETHTHASTHTHSHARALVMTTHTHTHAHTITPFMLQYLFPLFALSCVYLSIPITFV